MSTALLYAACALQASALDVADSGVQSVALPDGAPAAAALPFALGPNVRPDGASLTVDSLGWARGSERVYEVAGEIHPARVPQRQWEAELRKMKAGGLTSVSAYVFWIHVEEAEGVFDWSGRRDIRTFLKTVAAVGNMTVMLRVGPWDHGEVRNGGHPDWLLAKGEAEGFALRSNNTQYMAHVKKWYAALGEQVEGTFWGQGGVVTTVQVDNEIADGEYLLALRDLALGVGMAPVSYTITGWPALPSGYDAAPLLRYYWGYADAFWQGGMAPTPARWLYEFTGSTDAQPGCPALAVEFGGGMASAYAHRVHMASSDMPSFHLTRVAAGFTQLGYYMYHGGNNPRSTVLTGAERDAPEHTLQESAFQPAGALNPMTSFGYDFFAPIGEFGQLRQHYHQMRLTHLWLADFGGRLHETAYAAPAADAPLRWAVRSNGVDGFVFFNNYERLADLPACPGVRFALNASLPGVANVAIPHGTSPPLTVPAGVWGVFPFNLRFRSTDADPLLAWATVQVVARTAGTLYTIALQGVDAELGFYDNCTVTAHRGALAHHAPHQVLRGVAVGDAGASFAAAATVTCGAAAAIDVVVLAPMLNESVWAADVAGERRVVVSNATLAAGGPSGSLLVAAHTGTASVSLAPPPKALTAADGSEVAPTAAGAFGTFSLNMLAGRAPAADINATWALAREAGAPRDIPLAGSGYPQEPSAADWEAAGVWNVSLSRVAAPGEELLLSFDYVGDAARVSLPCADGSSRVLTDNWYSGYERGGRDGTQGGELQVGLTYLADELAACAPLGYQSLRLQVLPLQQRAVEKNVYLSSWPAFNTNTTAGPVALGLRGVTPVVLYHAALNATA